MNTNWHFPIMILVSLFIFVLIIRILLSKIQFFEKSKKIFIISLLVVVGGMAFGKYGAMYGLPWWLYYPIPMLLTVLLPPVALKFNKIKTLWYLLLSFLSAPFIHFSFSFFLGWTEYMPFLKAPYMKSLFS